MLYVSGTSDETIAHHGVPNAGVRFLQKPFSMATLLAKIRETLTEPWFPPTPTQAGTPAPRQAAERRGETGTHEQ